MSHYRRGKDREYRVRDQLIDQGWTLIGQTGGSHGAADLIMAHPDHGLALIQVGSETKTLGPADRERLCTHAELSSALPLLAVVTPRRPTRFFQVTRDTASRWDEWSPTNV